MLNISVVVHICSFIQTQNFPKGFGHASGGLHSRYNAQFGPKERGWWALATSPSIIVTLRDAMQNTLLYG